MKELVVWATLGEKGLGEPPLDSLRRVQLAWARLPGLALDSPAADTIFEPLIIYSIPRTPNSDFIHTNMQQAQEQIKNNSKQIKDNPT